MPFKRCPYSNDFWPISLGDLNIILGAWNGFSSIVIGLCSQIKIFENTFGHVTEMPATMKATTWRLKKSNRITIPQSNNKLLWNVSQLLHGIKKLSSKQVWITYILEKRVFAAVKGLWKMCSLRWSAWTVFCIGEKNLLFYMQIFGLIWISVYLFWKTAAWFCCRHKSNFWL